VIRGSENLPQPNLIETPVSLTHFIVTLHLLYEPLWQTPHSFLLNQSGLKSRVHEDTTLSTLLKPARRIHYALVFEIRPSAHPAVEGDQLSNAICCMITPRARSIEGEARFHTHIYILTLIMV
jgi:hypothetical protein